MDLHHYWGGDIQLSATGDLLTVDGVTETNQRILRGLMTSTGEYYYHTTYGAGIGKHVGDALTTQDYSAIQANIRGLVLSDPDVSPSPAPAFDFQASPNGMLLVSINYTYRPSGALQTLTFNVSK